jgi:hypothetical protein
MAYKTDDLLKQSLAAIEKHKLFFIEDIVAYLPCSKETFYQHKLHESDALKSALLKVKTEIKVSMRSKWYKSENPTLQMGLMKLIASPEELKQLSMTHVESNNMHEVKEFNLSDLVKFKNDSSK